MSHVKMAERNQLELVWTQFSVISIRDKFTEKNLKTRFQLVPTGSMTDEKAKCGRL